MFELMVETFAHLFSVVGAVLIIFGSLKSIFHIILREGLKRPYEYNHSREPIR